MKVYILSEVRSGSTVIDAQIAERFGIRSIGEALYYHDYKTENNHWFKMDSFLCSCGLKVSECGFWGGFEDINGENIFNYNGLPLWVERLKFIVFKSAKENYFTRFNSLKSSLQNRLGELDAFVDSSKHPEWLFNAISVHGDELIKVIHVERNFSDVYKSKLSHAKKLNGKSPTKFKIFLFTIINIYFIRSALSFLVHKKVLKKTQILRVKFSPTSIFLKEFLNLIDTFIQVPKISNKNERLEENHRLAGSPNAKASNYKFKQQQVSASGSYSLWWAILNRIFQ